MNRNPPATAEAATPSSSPSTSFSAPVRLAVNVCRMLVGAVFVFSGFVKAIDPLGTQYKMHDYLAAMGWVEAVPDWLTLTAAVALAAFEFALGVFALLAIRRRAVARIMAAFMTVMTLVTLWIAIADPVEDCGCFGDALHLTNTQTLLKNVALLACTLVMARWPLAMYRFVSKSTQWIAINFTVLFILLTSVYCLWYLPLFDFRPYHIGANIPKGMAIPPGAEQPQFETTFIMEKDGQRKTFTVDNYPDSTWQFIDSKTVKVKEGYMPPIHDFFIQRADGDDITQHVLEHKGYTFLLISPHLETADDSNFGSIDQIYEYAQDHQVPFYCLTASTEEAIQHWEDITGAEYAFCLSDETTLKTIVRSNPGLLLIKDGTIIRKWSHNDLPTAENLQGPLDKTDIGHLPADSAAKTLTKVALWFFLPLILLVIADRTWAWSLYIRRKLRKGGEMLKNEERKIMESDSSQHIISTFKKKKK